MKQLLIDNLRGTKNKKDIWQILGITHLRIENYIFSTWIRVTILCCYVSIIFLFCCSCYYLFVIIFIKIFKLNKKNLSIVLN